MRHTYFHILAAGLLSTAGAACHASLVHIGPVPDTGSGFGHVQTVLTLGSNHSTGTSSGAVGRAAGSDFTVGTVQPGSVHNATYSFGELHIGDAADLLFIFNPAEPGGGKNPIWLNALVLSIYSNTGGAAIFSASLAAPIYFSSTDPGIGNSGFGFRLDAPHAALAQAFVSATNRIGLSAAVSSATGGPDTFFTVASEQDAPLPEPGCALLAGIAMAGLWAARRRARG